MPRLRILAAFAAFSLLTSTASAQLPTPPAAPASPAVPAPPPAAAPIPYGLPIKLEAAKKILAAAQAEAEKNKWPVAISIVDGSGFLVAFQRLDDTQLASVEVSLDKAKTAALFRRPSKFFEEALEKGGVGLRVLALPGALPVEGGLPIIHEGKVIGAIGVSGVASTQDAQVARAGLAALEAAAADAPK